MCANCVFNCVVRKSNLFLKSKEYIACKTWFSTDDKSGFNKPLTKKEMYDFKLLPKDEILQKFVHLQNLYLMTKNRLHKTESLNRCQIPDEKHTAKHGMIAGNTDFLKCNYQYVALKVAYFGWDYNGLSYERDKAGNIEGLVKDALILTRLCSDELPIRVARSGRTDKGVSSFGQVLQVLVRTKYKDGPHVRKWVDPKQLIEDKMNEEESDFQTEEDLFKEKAAMNEFIDNILADANQELKPEKSLDSKASNRKDEISNNSLNAVKRSVVEYDYPVMLNNVLPPEIRVLSWAPVTEHFNAQFDCLERSYTYYFIRGNLDVEKMNAAAKLYCGIHNFKNLCDGNKEIVNYVKEIYDFSVSNLTTPPSGANDVCCATVSASGFAYHQVRYMMTTLFLIGMGKENHDLIKAALDTDSSQKRPNFVVSQAFPLTLNKTKFKNLNWQSSHVNDKLLRHHLNAFWYKLAVKGAMVKDLITQLKNEASIEIRNNKNLNNTQSQDSEMPENLDKNTGLNSNYHEMHNEFFKKICPMHNFNPYTPILSKKRRSQQATKRLKDGRFFDDKLMMEMFLKRKMNKN